jgi:hypothetical protein
MKTFLEACHTTQRYNRGHKRQRKVDSAKVRLWQGQGSHEKATEGQLQVDGAKDMLR